MYRECASYIYIVFALYIPFLKRRIDFIRFELGNESREQYKQYTVSDAEMCGKVIDSINRKVNGCPNNREANRVRVRTNLETIRIRSI